MEEVYDRECEIAAEEGRRRREQEERQHAKRMKKLKEALQKPSLILRSESFCLLHRLNFCANDCSGYF